MKDTRCSCGILLLLFGLAVLAGFAQQTPSRSNTGALTGRVLGEDGQPLAQAAVHLTAVANNAAGRLQMTFSDEEGKFQFTGLSARPYRLSANAPGYTLPNWPVENVYFHSGAQATLQLVKGGVLTGRVTQANGEPVVAVMVTAQRVRDAEGRPVNSFLGGGTRPTDDRGVYRLYGLMPGSYIVVANSSARMPGLPYESETPIYYPSSARAAAVELQVPSGAELSGIDIRYRSERGQTISGKVYEPQAGDNRYGVGVTLRYAGDGAAVRSAQLALHESARSYEITGVADGDYEVVAQRYSEDGYAGLSLPRRVLVRGADVGGVDLTLAPMAALAGRIVLETAANAPRCAKSRPASVSEIVLTAQRAEQRAAGPAPLRLPDAVPSEQGEFTLRNLAPGRYQFQWRLPNESWYVRNVTLPTPRSVSSNPARDGFALKAGEKIAGITATIAEGAASLRGKLSLTGGNPPARVRLHLTPAEPTAADEVWRYAETLAQADGSFAFDNLAPGKYWLTARAVPDEEAADRPAAPVAWERTERTQLRRTAAAAQHEIELTPCQRVNDYALKLAALQ